MHRSRNRILRLVPALFVAAGAVAAAASSARAQVREDSVGVAPTPADGATPIWMPDTAAIFLGHLRVRPAPLRLLGPRLRDERIQIHWTDLSGRWWHDLETQLAATRDTLWLDAHAVVAGGIAGPPRVARADTVRYLPYTPADTAPTLESFLPDQVGRYADLGMLVTGRGEMGGAWQRFEPCDAVFNSCDQGLRPRMRPDLQFGVLLGGTITDRVHVSVDYDQSREFDAANNINVYYQGLEDEILQRFEMGDVSITMPRSQYLTGGIPGGNFGFRALAQVGPLELQSVWAQQQGDIGALDFDIDARTGQLYDEDEKTIDDHAYASGRFFFLVDPRQMAGYPHVDVLSPDLGLNLPPALRPAGEIQVYRDEQLPLAQREASRVFLAALEAPDLSDTTTTYVRRLDPGDYIVHSSNLWIMLRQPLGPNETLAVAYVTESGDTVGTLDAVSAPSGLAEDAPVLRLLRPALSQHYPGASTWEYEMHQAYQLYTGDLEASDLDLSIKLGDAVQGQEYVDFGGRQVQLLRLFGLDENSPVDQVDGERIFLPSDYQVGTTPILGTYLVFPTLRPFAEPPPTSELTAEEAAAALGAEANDRIYDERDPDLRATPRFRLAVSYRVRTDGLISEFSLNSFGVREGSERILVDGVALTRGTDYTIDYTTGMVRLNNPQQIFAGRTSPNISARFEQASLFEIAPKSIFGTTARMQVGQLGEVNVVGLYQNQRSVMARPQLGNEPNSIMMGGVTTDLRFQAGLLDRALDAIPGLRLAGESSIGLSGELALSLPNPNTRGQAYLEDFESTSELSIPMSQNAWRLGSKPASNVGAIGALPDLIDQTTAFRLTWQHQAFATNGGTFGAFIADSIDRTIRTAGRDIPEAVLYVTMKDNDSTRAVGERVWRSMTTVLAAKGADLTSSEYLEFYALEATEDIELVFDVGTVSEDAFFYDSTGALTGTHPVTGAPWGIGTLDQEAAVGQAWGVDLDHGLWAQSGCEAIEPGMMFLLGDRRANCTRNNGVNDTEDLDGNGAPQLQDGPHFRYVVPIGPTSPYVARGTAQTGTKWRLYRVPLHGAAGLALNGAGEDTWRAVQHLRLTVTSGNCTGVDDCRADVLLLSRMRITGSTWKKREIEGVIDGLVGTEVVPGDHSDKLHVGPIGSLTYEGVYLSPPGSIEGAQDPSQTFGATGVETNEKGLRIVAAGLEPDARAEVFYRFPAESRSFMQYQQLRLWAMPRAGDWGEGGDVSLLVKIGTDDDNYYLYRTRLRPPIENRDITTAAYWLPEVVVDFEPWFELKARAEAMAGDTAANDGILWNADSTYAIVFSSRAQAPNLAGIRELSVAIHNESTLPADSIELWVNDVRLGDGRTEAGFATHFGIDATAADFATVRFSMANQNAMFHPINRPSTFQGSNDLVLNGRFELGHFAPAGWGLVMPMTVQHTRQGAAPAFLSQTDIRADDLEGLRESGASSTQIGVSLAKSTPAANPWLGLVVDGMRVNLNWQSASRDQFTQANSTSQLGGSIDYSHQLQPRMLDITPGFFVDLLRLLAPARVEQSEFFGRVANARLRWTPASVGFSTSYLDRQSETFNYPTVMRTAADDSIAPQRAPQQDLQNTATIGFRPFESLNAQVSMSSSRDLLGGDELRATPFGQRAVEDARARVGGLDLGWEKARTLRNSVQFQPRISSWLRPSITWTTDYQTRRTPHYLELDTVRNGTALDTVGAKMQRDFQVNGQLERRLSLDPGALARAAWGQEGDGLGFVRGALHTALTAVLPVDLSWTDSRASAFERSTFEPGYGYRFGLGELSALRLVHGDTAITAVDQTRFQARSGVQLPLGLQLDATYQVNDRHGVNRQGASNVTTDRTWPDVRLGMTSLPIPAVLDDLLVRVSASAGYRVESSENRFGGGGLRTHESQSVPVQFSTTFANGLTASYTGTFGSSDGIETSGLQEGTDRTHGVQLRFTFEPPESLGPKFREPMTASLGYTYTSNIVCITGGLRAPAGDARCARTVDRLSRDIHLTLETMIDDLNVGAQFSLNQYKSFTDTRDGSREFRLAIFANFNFGVGVLPEGLGGGRLGY